MPSVNPTTRPPTRVECGERVECPELWTYLPCALGRGHQRPHTPDSLARQQKAVTLLLRYRRALTGIASDELEHDCMADASHDVTRSCVRIAQDALSEEEGK